MGKVSYRHGFSRKPRQFQRAARRPKKVRFTREAEVALSSPPSSQQFYWDYHISGNYMYSASHTNGCDIFDITTPTSPSHVVNIRMRTPAGAASGMPCTDVITIGNTLFMCGRSINFGTPAPGYITTYDITTPTSPSFLATFEDTTPDLNPWYQGMGTDGTYLYVASQYDGVFVFNISNPAALTIHGSNSTGSWETSRLVVHNGYLYCANHGFGMRILDIATPATPGAVTDRSIAALVVSNGVVTDTMRVRNLVANGNYLYCAPNVATGDGDSPLRGLMVLDITDPTTVPTNGSTWVLAPIAANQVDVWNGQGDKPIMGISYLNNFVYLPNGQKGTSVFYVGNPDKPEYVGLMGTSISGTNLYQTLAFTKGGVDYVMYGSGAEVPATQTHNLFVDKIEYDL